MTYTRTIYPNATELKRGWPITFQKNGTHGDAGDFLYTIILDPNPEVDSVSITDHNSNTPNYPDPNPQVPINFVLQDNGTFVLENFICRATDYLSIQYN